MVWFDHSKTTDCRGVATLLGGQIQDLFLKAFTRDERFYCRITGCASLTSALRTASGAAAAGTGFKKIVKGRQVLHLAASGKDHHKIHRGGSYERLRLHSWLPTVLANHRGLQSSCKICSRSFLNLSPTDQRTSKQLRHRHLRSCATIGIALVHDNQHAPWLSTATTAPLDSALQLCQLEVSGNVLPMPLTCSHTDPKAFG